MRYHDITQCDLVNGDGPRTVLWVSHCEHKCEGCHNPQTWSEDGGVPFDKDAEVELFAYLSDPFVQGLTLSGGDPLSTKNRDTVAKLIMEVKRRFPHKDIWVYTGYLYEDLLDYEALEYIDVLIDGKFVESLSKPHPMWRGSSNQRVIDVKKTLAQGEIVLHCE